MAETLTRRVFIKAALAGGSALVFSKEIAALAAASPEPKIMAGGRTMQTSEGLIEVSNYRVQQGDYVNLIAQTFHTRPDLIKQANGLKKPFVIYTGEMLTLPLYPVDDPTMFVPQPDVIHHRVHPGETDADIANRYTIPEPIVSWSRHFQQDGVSYVTIDGFRVPAIVPTTINMAGPDYPPSPQVVDSLVQRVAHVMAYKLGGKQYLGPMKHLGLEVNYTDRSCGFSPPNHIWISGWTDRSREGWLVQVLGHEMGHYLLDGFGWGDFVREGAAGQIGCRWGTGKFKEYGTDPFVQEYYEQGYYDLVNTPELRTANLPSNDIRARILGVEAWNRIENTFPSTEVLATLIRGWSQVKSENRPTADAQIWAVAQSILLQNFGPVKASQIVEVIQKQHILFTSGF